MSDVRWHVESGGAAAPAHRVGTTSSGEFVAEWEGIGTFRGSASAGHFEPDPRADPRIAAKLERGVARAFQQQIAGKLALHAGAAERAGKAVVLLGASGSGKSTATATLCAREGFSLLADDVAAIDQEGDHFVVRPTEAVHSLRDGALALMGFDETRAPATLGTGCAGESSRLAAVVLLSPRVEASSVTVQRLRGREALTALVRSTFHLWPDARRNDLDRISEVCERVAVWQLQRPLDASLASVAEMLVFACEAS